MWRIATLIGFVALAGVCSNGQETRERLPVGEFTARKMKVPPKLDGKLEPGEWDKALVTAGLITPFDHELQEAETTLALGYDEKNLYFMARARRGDREWKLWKKVRENDDYSFGDPSIEIWVTPPRLVPETYQSIINTYPAVLDQQMIPSRGYTAQGWKAGWTVGVSESETEYSIEAAVPIKDFGSERIAAGEIWRFLFARTSPGTLPRAQASWSVTQGFAELGQHVPVRMSEDDPVVQLYNVTSVCTGQYRFPMAVVAPDGQGAEVEVELRFHQAVQPGADDKVEKKTLALAAGQREAFEFAGAVPEANTREDAKKTRRGYFTLKATRKDGTLLFRQSFPYALTGWAPKTPVKPEKDREAKELELTVKYGPESNVVILRADILDLPERERVAGGTIRVFEADHPDKPLLTQRLPAFRNAYADAWFSAEALKAPVLDYEKQAKTEETNLGREKENKKRAKEGQPPVALEEFKAPDPKTVRVEVTVEDRDGKALKTESAELALLRYRFKWSDNRIGLSDKVIPPWTPVTCDGGTVGVWNRTLGLNGLGLLEKIGNGGVAQVSRMRLVAVRDGKECEISASAPVLKRLVDAAATLTGTGGGAGLKLSAETRVEYDGFTLSTLTIGPEDPVAGARVEKLFLELVLPEAEATHFCATAGGWAAVHDRTPEYWSSQQTASGMLAGDFVPYIWLTNSERGFLWAADNDKGWITDQDKSLPTQEIRRANGSVTLRVHFIELPTELKKATTLTYAWQAFPSRPLPAGWRAILCGSAKAFPSARASYFWFEGDWAVLWPYYCSPFPWNLEKSRQLFARYPRQSEHHPMVGSIAHSIGRYMDYEKRKFDAYAVDWGETPGETGNANTTQGKGPADFRLFHYQQWVREADFRGLYVDENYLALEKNFLTGGAYYRPDGRLQPGYSYFGLREYYKRLKTMFYENGVSTPNLWLHVSSGAAYHAWPGDVFFEGENVEPTDEHFDYLEVLPADRMRAIGSSVCAGGAMTMMCQSQRHPSVFAEKHTHQFLGWVLAHDILPEQVAYYPVLAQEGRLYQDAVEFHPYWKAGTPFKTQAAGCVVSAHKSGRRALVWIVNTAREDREAEVAVDWAALGFARERCAALDAETGAELPLRETGFGVRVLRRDFTAVHLVERNVLKEGESFYASFDRGRTADEAFGSEVLLPEDLALVQGRQGKALDASKGVQLWPHLNVTDKEGRVRFQGLLRANARGAVFSTSPPDARKSTHPPVPTLAVKVDKTGLSFGLDLDKKDPAGKLVSAPALAAGWHEFDLSWKDGKAALKVDGALVGAIEVQGLSVPGGTGAALLEGGPFLLGGPRGGVLDAVDELRCYRRAE